MLNRFLFFSRGQQIGIVVLLVLIAAIVALNALLPKIVSQPVGENENDSAFSAQVQAFEQTLRDKPKPVWQSPFEARRQTTGCTEFDRPTELKPIDFDPNTLDSAGFAAMGFKSRDISRIMSFRRKGNQFRTAEFFVNDFCRFTPEQAEQLLPHVIIATSSAPIDTTRTLRKEYVHIELNAADTTELKRMPGIGSGRAKQIVNYRYKLGGFANIGQLLEIKNFPQETFDKIEPYLSVDQNLITKIQVNKASVEKLKKHPYINFYQAKAIYELRRTKGRQHRSIEDILPR